MKNLKNIVASLILTAALSTAAIANDGIIITDFTGSTKSDPCTPTSEKISDGIIITDVVGIIITDLVGIIITDFNEPTNCGIIITD